MTTQMTQKNKDAQITQTTDGTQMTQKNKDAQITQTTDGTQMTQKNKDAQITQTTDGTQMSHDDNLPHKEVTYNIIGIAMRIHRELGSGFLEAVYEEALIAEFNENNISYRNQIPLEIHYKSTRLKKKYRADFIINGEVLVEIKKTKGLTKIDEMQMINYLKASNLKVGLLLNFGMGSLQWKRMIY